MSKTNRKGLSDVITTVLIILLVLAAVVLIWSFIRRPLTQGGETIEVQSECFKLELAPTGCAVNLTEKTAQVTVQWKAGNVRLQAVRFIVTDEGGSNALNTTATTNAEVLGTIQGVVNVSALDIGTSTSPKTVTLSVAGQVQAESGAEDFCSESAKIVCTVA